MPPPRPHPLAVSRLGRLADRTIETIWARGLDDKPPLEPGYLWGIGSKGFEPADETACRSDEDIADFRDRLDRLCEALRDEADLNSLGHTLAYGQLTAAVRKRHALGRLWRKRPELAASPVAAPIVVVGQMRSGTTRLHRLLAADPAHAATRFCDAFDPVPRHPDWRPLKAAGALWIARRLNPWLDTLHPFGATRPDEEIGWISAALSPCAFEVQWAVPGFVRWSEARSAAPVYREFARIVSTDAAIHGNARQPRAMKCPQFSEDLAALMQVFPHARLVFAERADAAVHASSVSLVASQTALQSRSADLDAINSECWRKLSLRRSRIDSFRAKGPQVAFDDLDADWKGAIAAVYRALDLELTPQALAAMGREQRAAARSPHVRHAAALREFAGRT